MKNKKALILPEETLKIIIAVMALIILFYLGWKMAGIFMTKTSLEQAKETFVQINDTINWMEENEVDFNNDILLLAPNKWLIINLTKNKLCICEGIDNCEKRGICALMKNEIGILDREYETHILSPPGPSKTPKILINSANLLELKIRRIIEEDNVKFYLYAADLSLDMENFLEEFLTLKLGSLNIKPPVRDTYFTPDRTVGELVQQFCTAETTKSDEKEVLFEYLKKYGKDFCEKKGKDFSHFFIYLDCEANPSKGVMIHYALCEYNPFGSNKELAAPIKNDFYIDSFQSMHSEKKIGFKFDLQKYI